MTSVLPPRKVRAKYDGIYQGVLHYAGEVFWLVDGRDYTRTWMFPVPPETPVDEELQPPEPS